jgi:hypothetical protein
MLAAEKNHRHAARGASAPLLKNIGKHIAYLQRRIDDLKGRMDRLVAESETFKAKDEILQSITGIGPQVSSTLRVHLPELARAAASRSPPWWAWRPSPTTAALAAASATSAAAGAKCAWRCARPTSRPSATAPR